MNVQARDINAVPPVKPLMEERRAVLPKTEIATVRNIMTIDLEEWFQVTNFEKVIARSQWDSYPLRAPLVMPQLLDLFAERKVTATIFTLGWVAQKYPELVRRIHQAGHEIASHGYDHRLVTSLTPAEFRQQLLESKDILQQITGQAVNGYRAPSYSFCNNTLWVVDELVSAGYLYDSSVFPFNTRHLVNLCVSRQPCYLQGAEGRLVEYPLATLDGGKHNLPIAGGGYFRLLPYDFVRQGVEKLNRRRQPAVMYFHPWEFDPGQPRVTQATWLAQFRHYTNLDVNLSKFRRLVTDFRFASFKDVYWNEKDGKFDLQPQS